MQVFCFEELLRELAERVFVSETGTSMFVVDNFASQEPRSEGPIKSNSALSSLFAMESKKMANQPQGEMSRT